MCDYSLHGMPTRLAVEGEQLRVHRFFTSTLGLASPAEMRAPAPAEPGLARPSLWSRVKHWFILEAEKPVPAVCIPPGARLMLHDIPERLQHQLGVGPAEEVTFTQLGAEPFTYRDALRFSNGCQVLLQRLEEGQRVEVLCLSLPEEAPRMTRPAAIPR